MKKARNLLALVLVFGMLLSMGCGAMASGEAAESNILPWPSFESPVYTAKGREIEASFLCYGEFDPNGDVTREQIATMLYRYADYLGMNTKTKASLKDYTDVDEIHAWALDAMKWAKAIELMEGRTETTLNPRENTMRSELATLLMRWCEEIVK